MYKWQEIIDEFLTDIQIKGYSKVTIQNYKYKLKNIKDYFLSQNIEFVDKVTKQDGKLQVQVSHPDKPVSACCN